jgi:hypothetical protein
MEIKITTSSSVEGQTIQKGYKRIEVSAPSLAEAETKLLEKVADVAKRANWLIDVKYYQRPNQNFLMSGTPVILVEEGQP